MAYFRFIFADHTVVDVLMRDENHAEAHAKGTRGVRGWYRL